MTIVNSLDTKFKVFAEDASSAAYLPVKFATDSLVNKSNWFEIANKNYAFGLEALEGDLQLRDLNSVLYYMSQSIKYLYQRGVAEWSKYEDYVAGSLVSYEGSLYVAIAPSFGKPLPKEPKYDSCGNVCEEPVDCSIVEVDKDPCALETNPKASDKWCSIVTACEYKSSVKKLEETNKALQNTLEKLKGVESFTFNEDTGKYELMLSDGSTVTADHKATVELRNFDGSYTAGYLHKTSVGG